MKIKELLNLLESYAPKAYQESYDNSGLLTGSPEIEITNVLISLDCTEEVIQEALQKKCNVVLAHHPIIFSGLKKLVGANYVERTIIKAIKNDISIIAIHTNLDNVADGVNFKIAEKLKLQETKILAPKEGTLCILTVYIPEESFEKVSQALFEAGCGHIGNYSHAGFSSDGIGSFKGNKDSNPNIGEAGKLETVKEIKFETIFPYHIQWQVVSAMKAAHPYEEIAYQIIKLENTNQNIGAGMIGSLSQPMDIEEFLVYLKKVMNLEVMKYTHLNKSKILKVAICGGSGSFLIHKAMAAGADVYISADFKYHEFFEGEGRLMLIDIGHYESEVFTKELLNQYLLKKITTFAPLLSEINTNPIKYYY